MSLNRDDFDRLWDALGRIHVDTDAVRRLTRIQRMDNELSNDEDHLLNVLDARMNEIDRLGNQASGFLRDYVRDHAGARRNRSSH